LQVTHLPVGTDGLLVLAERSFEAVFRATHREEAAEAIGSVGVEI